MKKILMFMMLLGLTVLSAAPEMPYRILVDKVFSRTDDRRIPDEKFTVIKEAGIQILSPRWSMVEGQDISRDLELCRKNGLFYLPWGRGTLDNPGKNDWQLTTVFGKKSPLYAPCSPEFWEYFESLLLKCAKLPAPNLGVFLDFEHYPNPRIMECYDYSYDDGTKKLFNDRMKLNADKNPEKYKQFQSDFWYEKAAEVGRKIKKINPAFKFFIYPGVNTPFLRQLSKAMTDLGFEVNSAGAATYGRETFQSLNGCAESLGRLVKEMSIATAAINPKINYLAGIDPIEIGNTPELVGLKLKSAAQNAKGYWIFFEGFRPAEAVVGRYMEKIKQANQEISDGDFALKSATETHPDAKLKFTKDGAAKVMVSGEMRGAISKFYNAMPDFEAVNLTGSSLAAIKDFDLLVLQSLTVAECDKEEVYSALRSYVESGKSILFCYSSIESLPGIFPEIVRGKLDKIALPSEIDKLKIVDKLRIFKQKKPFVIDLPFEKYSAYYMYSYTMTPGAQGAVIAVNMKRNPVCVGGIFGKGKVIFCGDFFGRREVPVAQEAEFFQSISKYLTGKR